MAAVALLVGFLGLGIGQGLSRGADLRSGKLIPNMELVFSDGKVMEAYVVGVNSGYLFYTEAGDVEVTVAPIADNIQSLRRLSTGG